MLRSYLSFFLAPGAALLLSCGSDAPIVPPIPDDVRVDVTPIVSSEVLPGCNYASPVRVMSQGSEYVISVGQMGRMIAVDPLTGETAWSHQFEADDDGNWLDLLATPVVFDGDKLLVGWQEITEPWIRVRHRIEVFNLTTRQPDPAFESLVVAGAAPALQGGEVVFQSRFQLMRSTFPIIEVPDRDLGLAYISFGNGPSEQPFHGWVFELDLDAWRDGTDSDAIASVMVTTAENECGPDGNRDPSVCGGGVWNAFGPAVHEYDDGSYELLVPTGNGRVDFDRGAFAHAVMRVRRGLDFDPSCDAALCADFDELDPSIPCLESCDNVFIPRLGPGEAPLAPEDGTCDGMTFIECYGALDADLGANSPVIVQPQGGPQVVVQAGKDGAVYLVDHEHLGTMYQRLQVMDFCGTPDSPCLAFWVGMFVTRPAVTEIDGDPVVILASVMADRAHPSGITALRVTMQDGQPRMDIMWQQPDFDTPAALEAFRHHPGRPIIHEIDGEPFVFVLEPRRSNDGDDGAPPGRLWGVRVRDGELVVHEQITNAGQRYVLPLLIDDRLYLNTCSTRQLDSGQLLGYRLGRSDAE